MKTYPLPSPERPKDASRVFDTKEPQLVLKTMDEDEFERVVGEWAYSCLKKEKKYSNVALLGRRIWRLRKRLGGIYRWRHAKI